MDNIKYQTNISIYLKFSSFLVLPLISSITPYSFLGFNISLISSKTLSLRRQREKSKQTDGSPLALFNLFVERTREMLHIVLAMSPIGDAFRNRLRKFPSLVNCCTIDWFQVSWLNRETRLLYVVVSDACRGRIALNRE